MEVVLRALVVYVFLILVMRALGKRELTGMTAFDLVLLIVMGDLVQQGITQEDMSLTGAFLAVGTIAVLLAAMSYLQFRWPRLRVTTEGSPVIVVRDGEPDLERIRTERLTIEDVNDAAREHGIGDLADVRFAVLEADGKFSFVKRADAA
ncbi:MAG: YetF domain-containing protein [Actinomycetota bacterium]